jgi:hypothetical protein
MVEAAQKTDVGMVYNFSHGHNVSPTFPPSEADQSYVVALNVTGMVKDGEPK